MEEDFTDHGCPLYFPIDKKETVEDCISASLGEYKAYAEAMLACRGKWTFTYSHVGFEL
ncbi:MAG: hypothetical protein PHF18_10070 [Methanosarcina sp.]|uniref:hypothetical protein n=1 Tax=Methanosarcina sp. TaxID=2213 RepID=UPI00261948D2|nr:hypothetical protein [Methanosarcina sp.]MDD3247177.1 hypothetical protein [Methanosarcina sp.]MDD4248447.1 hypothetical protein [Methanosarcina sp.]